MSEDRLLIKVEDVSFSYGRHQVLREINLDIFVRDFLAIIGPNGSGKTTLIKIVLGLLDPREGGVYLLGKSIKEFQDWGQIGYVPQKATHIDPYFPASVYEVVAMGLLSQKRYRGFFTTGNKAKVRDTLALVGMADKITEHIGALSGGQQQRVFIARALVAGPRVLILDEPTAGIDAEAQLKFYDMLNDLNREQGITVVLVTHDIGVITKHVKKVACLNQRLVFHGSHEEFCNTDLIHNMFGEGGHIICHRH